MGPKSHILDFNANAKSRQASKEARPLPVLVDQASQVFISEIEKNLQAMFEQADDSLFDMSDKGFNDVHFDAMRMLRLKKAILLRHFKKEIQTSFSDNLGKYDHSNTGYSEEVGNISFENIALVEDNELEEGIAIDAMVKKARTRNVDALEQIKIRLDTLFSNRQITTENNPFEPAFICMSYQKASAELDMDIKSLLVVYKLFERLVMSELEDTYLKVNRFFIDKGVLPDLRVSGGRVPRNSAQRRSTPATAAGRAGPGNFNNADFDNSSLLDIAVPENNLSSAEDAYNGPDRRANVQNGQAASAQNRNNNELLSVIQSLLVNNGASPEYYFPASDLSSIKAPVQAADGSVKIETPQLIAALTNLQATQSAAKATGEQSRELQQNGELQQANIVAGIKGVLGSQLNTSDKAIENGALGQFNDDMIDIVSMLFDFILDDKNLHVEIKSVIARLQIPMLKVGLVDRTFFSNKNHPARILLNEISYAGLSWDPEDVEAKAMLDKIVAICEEVISEFKDDVSIFNYLLEDFQAFKGKSQQRASIFERRTAEAEEGKARAECARSQVNIELEKICRGKRVSESARQLLKNVWAHVMFLEKLKDSNDGWQKTCSIARLLVWSTQPVKSAAILEKLLGRIPILVKNLRKGFNIISISPIDATRMLDKLEEEHREIISNAKSAIESDKEEDILRLAPLPLVPEVNSMVTPSIEEAMDKSSAANDSAETAEQSAKSQSIAVAPVVIEEIGFSNELLGLPEFTDDRLSEKVSEASLQLVQGLSAGHWVELDINEKSTRCKLAAKIAATGKYIFVNRNGVKVAAMFTEELAMACEQGRLHILNDEALFDRALESVISNLRAMKSET